MRLRKSFLAATACASALLAAMPVAAQEAQLSEIIVTARKRQESILNVPVVETAIPQEQLERFQTQDLSDLATRVPGLNLGESVLSIGTQVSLRGVGTSTLDAGVDQSVSLNLDGLQLSQGLAYSSGLFDVGLVEVLKGPQALFYGKNSPGGVISMRTADPTDRFEVMVRGGYESQAQEGRGEIVISGPVHETLKLRLATMYAEQAGYFKNFATGLAPTGAITPRNKRTGFENFVARGTALWNPTDKFSARLKANYVYDYMDGSPAQQYTSCPDGVGAVPGFGIPFLGGGEDCRKDRVFRIVDLSPTAFLGVKNAGIPFVETTQQFGTLELNYNLTPELALTSTTGYYHLKSSSLINGTQSTFAATPLGAANDFRREEFTQEVRLNSDWDHPVNFTAGGFYQDAELSNLINLYGNTALLLPPLLAKGQHNLDIESLSFFGQVRWDVWEELEISAGARWTEEKRSDSPVNLITGVAVPVTLAVPKIKSDNISPELTVTWRPTDTFTAFGSLKRGYKSGSFTITTPAMDGLNNSFGDEKVEGGEVGLKSRLLDRRLAMNLAYYNYRYTGLQVGVNSPAVNGLPVIRTLNAGAAQVYGVDFDASYRPPQVEGLGLNLAVNWNHARFKTLDNVPCWGGQMISEGCDQLLNPMTGLYTSQSLSGGRLVRAPDWQASFGFDYERAIGDGLTLVVSNANQYSSKYLANLGDRADFYQQGFIKSDLTLALRGADERWEVALIGKNLTDRLTAGNCINFNAANGQILGGQVTGGTTRGPAGVDEVGCFADRGRELWVRVTFRPAN
ncbi:TonB-dependent receptor [Phenylobacterium sp. LjRoot219]|uniref:TonB-dependent receptor n=1 Tax=Phenylobacterium sp. LjRoot219 TaxID=3342283 RepID=UPI003ECE4C29